MFTSIMNLLGYRPTSPTDFVPGYPVPKDPFQMKPGRIEPRTLPPQMSETDDLCVNCQPIKLKTFLNTRYGPPNPINLGKYDVFRSTLLSQCNMCSLLSSLLPEQPVDTTEDIFLLSTHSIGRQEPGAALVKPKDDSASGPYSTLLYVGFQSSREYGLDFTCCHEAPNAIGIDWKTTFKALAVKEIHQFSVNIEAVCRWIALCEKLHLSYCASETGKLFPSFIRLIDCHENRRIDYTGEPHVDYLCLSYVWGPQLQPVVLEGESLASVPKVVRDAMKFVQDIGQRYLWVDSICINQQDTDEKTVQIALMDSIYCGAWATIVALSSPDSQTGLPRVTKSFPGIPQQTFELQGYELRTVLPTLRQQIKEFKWATRAWTYQEALLSPRCLYFTPHQVYFECNMMQCCESLDETNSPFHIQIPDRTTTISACGCGSETAQMHGHGIFRDPVLNMDFNIMGNEYKLQKYNRIVREYCSRDLSYSSDALNACSAVLNRLEGAGFSQGFLWGLPLDYLMSSLIWEPSDNPMRRREGFPSWSWVGWIGGFQECPTRVLDPPTEYSPPLRIWIYKKNIRTLIVEIYKGKEIGHYGGLEPVMIHSDTITEINLALERNEWKEPRFNLKDYTVAERDKLLLVQGLICNMTITGFQMHSNIAVEAKVNGVRCMIRGYHREILLRLASGHHRLLLMQRRIHSRHRSGFSFLVVKWQASNGCGHDEEEMVLTGERLGIISVKLDREADDGLRRFFGKGRMEMRAVVLR